MRARGVPTVGYLDDFICVLETREQAEEAMLLLVEFVTFLGFKVNSAKCEGPAQVLEFLGVLLDTSGEVCTASIDEERIAVVVKQAGALMAQSARGMVARWALESLLGLLAFCSHVVWGLSLYTRRGFIFLAATVGRRMVRLPHQVREDLVVLEQVVRQYNGRNVVLERRLVDERHFATDASGTLGFGFFMLSWEDLARMSGRTVVVRIDNQFAMHQVGSWWGPVAYLPLLRQIFFVCARHDIRLQPVYITTHDNLLADLLSRLEMSRFLAEHKAFLRADIWRQDRDDWMVCLVRWAALDQEFGPFTMDSCVAVSRANSYCYHSWSREEDARMQRFDGHNAWGNLPFSIMVEIIRNFLRCKRRQQWGTSACFLVPVWDGDEGWELVKSLPGAAAGGGALQGGGSDTIDEEGVKRCWGRPPRPVMPLTLVDLARMAVLISAHDLGREALWAAILVGFFGLFRKDNLTTGKVGAWNTRGALVRDDVLFHEDGSVVWIRVRHSKTIQCGEQHHWVPLRAVPGSLLCLVRALRRLMERTAGRPGDSALFVMEKVTGRRVTVVPMAHDALVAGIKSLAERVGLDPSSYAGHSLRRGGATAALRLDVASIYIKLQRDWKSDCFEHCCELDTEQKLILPGAMAEAAAAASR
ncbi:hypothetical protein CYMTET_46923 [Cymbomonas tetramitiformis]|uniref:Reverse transcriptase domain-containing protein n=1 Tax=Cymbomonas tetramitiformis TaxID=36881 RepID=A0AAE0BX07_9CHLO|nr:hypothetical protein CYMTET_46923 [Cymbomonas tetramitiformis]